MAAEDADVAEAVLDVDYADVFGVGGEGEEGVGWGEVLEVDDFVVMPGEAAEDWEGGSGRGEGERGEEEGLVVVNCEESGEGFVVSVGVVRGVYIGVLGEILT